MLKLCKKIFLGALCGAVFFTGHAVADEKPVLMDSAYLAAKNTAQIRAKKDAICTSCHDESEGKPILSIAQTKHGVKGDVRTPTCQACHGESTPHVKGKSLDGSKGRPAPDVVYLKGSYKASSAQVKNDSCQTCHQHDDKRTHWGGSKHETADVACSSCHVTHAPKDRVMAKQTQAEVCYTCHKEQRAQGRHVSIHPVDAGKIACSDCHAPHGATSDKSLVKNTINETCFTCHADKRGPFLWEHQPATEDCTSCHVAHGSNIAPLLKSRAPFLCQECHDGPHNSRTPYGSSASEGKNIMSAGRSCLNCHTMVHGSNHAAGAFLHR